MKVEASHLMLASGADLHTAKKQVRRFLDKTQLVQYDLVHINDEQSVSAADAGFWEKIELGTAANKKILAELTEELKQAGFHSIKELLRLPQGFQSKILHTMAHILDGFFGIDTTFYNLIDDSHWLSDLRKQEIEAHPAEYWLLDVTGTIKVVSSGKAVLLRAFEKDT